MIIFDQKKKTKRKKEDTHTNHKDWLTVDYLTDNRKKMKASNEKQQNPERICVLFFIVEWMNRIGFFLLLNDHHHLWMMSANHSSRHVNRCESLCIQSNLIVVLSTFTFSQSHCVCVLSWLFFCHQFGWSWTRINEPGRQNRLTLCL